MLKCNKTFTKYSLCLSKSLSEISKIGKLKKLQIQTYLKSDGLVVDFSLFKVNKEFKTADFFTLTSMLSHFD